MNRGDVILVRFPHPSGLRGKKRPAVIVQADAYVGTVGTLVVVEGKATGLVRNSVVSCLVLVTVYADTVAKVMGTLSPTMKQKLDDCLKAALELT